jgi:AraC-like DNA-binding protein
MLGEQLDSASTAFRLGYHDAAHFSREFKSLFGIPPVRDLQRLREMPGEGARLTIGTG